MYEKIIGLGEKSIRKSYYPQLRKKLQELEHEIAEREQRELELRRSYESQEFLNKLLKRSMEPLPLKDLLEMALDGILAFSWFENKGSAGLFLEGMEPGVLCLKQLRQGPGLPGPMCDRVIPGHCLCGQAAETGKLVSSIHTVQDVPDHKHYCIPICIAQKTIGVICIALPMDHGLDTREEAFFGAIADTLAGIIQNYRVSEEKAQIEHQLLQMQKIEAIGSLTAGIAHDFNNLLTPILGYSEIALLELPESDPVTNYLSEVVKAACLSKDLVQQILAFSRQGEHELKPLKLHVVVEEALKLLRSTIPSTIEIINRVDASHDTIMADLTQIHQIIMNLCTNAYQAMKDTGGTLAVGLKTIRIDSESAKVEMLGLDPGAYQVLEVSDTGTGMNRTTMARIFDPYFTTKSVNEGTGLGLSVVLGIVKCHGGDINVYSEPGQGTTFRVYLPCVSTVMDKDPIPAPAAGGHEHVMVVDDEQAIAQMMASMLSSKGYTVTGFTTSSEALEWFRDNAPHVSLVITDMTMPGMTGAQLALQLRKIKQDIPMILCTGFSDLINEQKSKAHGFTRFLMKPIIMNTLCQTVRDVLDTRPG
ncbi:ATP-binding protein [Desulfoluna limicola]|nr:ATP-binding protein [Desulfoluna limicola]